MKSVCVSWIALAVLCSVVSEAGLAAKQASESRPELSRLLLARFVEKEICRDYSDCIRSEVMMDRGGEGYNINFYRVPDLEFARLLISDVLQYCSTHKGASASIAVYDGAKRTRSGVHLFENVRPILTMEVN